MFQNGLREPSALWIIPTSVSKNANKPPILWRRARFPASSKFFAHRECFGDARSLVCVLCQLPFRYPHLAGSFYCLPLLLPQTISFVAASS